MHICIILSTGLDKGLLPVLPNVIIQIKDDLLSVGHSEQI